AVGEGASAQVEDRGGAGDVDRASGPPQPLPGSALAAGLSALVLLRLRHHLPAAAAEHGADEGDELIGGRIWRQRKVIAAYSVCSPPPGGEGWGWGSCHSSAGGAITISPHHPPPHPSPTRGEGADRVCRLR